MPIPHVYNGRNKTFFYFDYEGVRLSANSLIDTNTIPASWLTGDLSGAGTHGGRYKRQSDPRQQDSRFPD